ncbi:MAG: type II secretion system F family protein [Opitutaceae bacterium]|nr:type II secretion system F family protein [Opitutaceae bacterium]
MATFHYIARDAQGAENRGKLEAGSRKQALAQLRARQLTPSRLDESAAAAAAATTAEQSGGFSFGPFGAAGGKKRFGREHALPFLRALMGLVTSGIQVADGVKLLAKRLSDPALRALAAALWDQLSQGRSLSQAMAANGAVFDDATVNLVQAGEATGRLGGVLERLVLDLEERGEIRSRLVAAMAYPALILAMAVVVILIFLFFLLPRIEALLASLQGNLPFATRLLIGLAHFLVSYYGLFFVLVVATGITIFWAWRRKPAGRLISDGWLLKVTGVGSFILANDILRLTQAFSLLLENGITTLPALAMTERTIQNQVFRAAFAEARGKIAEGAGISTALGGTGFFPPLVIDVISVGESTGNIVPSLKEVARDFRKRIDKQVGVFVSFVSIGALMLSAGFVALVAFGIISAVFQISSSLKAG